MKNPLTDLISYLQQCDITRNDALVYLSLLNKGPLNPTEIAKITGIKRARVYDSLKRLLERGFITQSLEKSRAVYMSNNPRNLIADLEENILQKKEAINEIETQLANKTAFIPMRGIFFYNTDISSRLKLAELIDASRKTITIVAVFPPHFKDEGIIPTKKLAQKSLLGQEIKLFLNIDAKNWESCVYLSSKHVKIYHYPHSGRMPTLIYLIDDESLVLSSYTTKKEKIELRYAFQLHKEKDLILTFKHVIKGYMLESLPLKKRLKELEETIIYPTDKLKSIFKLKK